MHWEQRTFTTIKKPWLDIKTQPWLYSICRCKEEKFILWKGFKLYLIFPRLKTFFLLFFSSDLFSLVLINSCDLISWVLIGNPYIILGEKSPRNPKLRTLFPVTFCQRNFLPTFLIPGFSSRNLFSCEKTSILLLINVQNKRMKIISLFNVT